MLAPTGTMERYEELPDWDKDANWHIFVGDQLPDPLSRSEIPACCFGTIPERMVRALGDKDWSPVWQGGGQAIGDNLLPSNSDPLIVKAGWWRQR